MSDVELTGFGNGSIEFIPKVEAVPTRTERKDGITINNMGSDEIPAHFETSSMIRAKVEVAGISAYTTFHVNDIVLAETADVSYREIEDKAARRIAPMLRALADQIDQQMADFDEREAARKAAL